MKLKHSTIALALLSAFSVSVNASSLIFNDGQLHEDDSDLNIIHEPKDDDRFGINAIGENTNVSLTGKNISVRLEGQGTSVGTVAGVRAEALKYQKGAILSLGSKETELVSVNVVGGKNAVGIWAYNPDTEDDKETNDGGQITINGKNFDLKVHAEDGVAYGLYAQNSSKKSTSEKKSTIIVNAQNTRIEATSATSTASAIEVMSEGILKINGNLYAKGDNAIVARGGADVAINEENNKVVQLEGDINFNYDKQTSGTGVDANVLVNLSGINSYWNGNVIVSYGSGAATDEDLMKVSGLKLGINNGAQWTPDLYKDQLGDKTGFAEIALNELNFNDGIINIKHGSKQSVQIETMKGTGGTINLTATTDNGKTIDAGSLIVETTDGEVSLSVNAVGITADDIKDANEAMESLNQKVTATREDAKITKIQRIAEGDIKGEMVQTFAADGSKSEVRTSENTKLASFRGLNAAALVAWRDEVAYTNQRMEFLRDNSHAYGAWAQVYGGESKYEDKAELTTTTVQVGADMTIGDWVAGAAFSYMSGEADLLRGDADTDAYTLSLYAERNFDSGLFVNGLARYGRLSTDATAGNMDASYDNNAFSLGGNVGYRFTFAEQAFVEPNFGLQYTYVMGDDYKASNGVKVEQDDFDALIASLGARVGFNFPNNAGKLFARASVNHDFLGEIDGTAGNGKAVQDMYTDLGGTWVTYGVGTQFNITDNLSVWGNVDRTTGGEVSTNYMMNAGLRYVF